MVRRVMFGRRPRWPLEGHLPSLGLAMESRGDGIWEGNGEKSLVLLTC